jgi:hypothetical protein
LWEAFVEANQGRTILKLNEYERCLAIRDAVRAYAPAAAYLRQGKAEQAVSWTDPATRLRCKGRLDWICDAGIVDLKTTNSMDPRRFGALCARMGYHAQLAFYRDGYKLATGQERRAVIVGVEAEPPHDVGVLVLGEDELYAGVEEYAALLARVVECRKTDTWPGRYEGEQFLELPAWAWPDDEDVESFSEGGGA